VVAEELNGNFGDYDIKLQTSALMPHTGEEEDYITQIGCDINFITPDFKEHLIGRLSCQFVDIDRIVNDGYRVHELLDAASEELFDVSRLFRRRGGYGPQLTSNTIRALGFLPENYESFFENFIYVERLEILPKHRGRRLGQWVLQNTLSYLAATYHFEFFVMIPAPLNGEGDSNPSGNRSWDGRMKYELFETDCKIGTIKLRQYYAQTGFVLVKGTGLMVCGRDQYLE
jgi:hypothetical protein